MLLVVLTVAFAVYPFMRSFPALLAVMVVVAVAEVSAVRGAYLAGVAGPDLRVRARAFNQAVTNVGFVVGAAGAGVVLQVDVPAGYMALLLVNSALFAAGVVVLLTMPDVAASSRSIVLIDRRYLLVCLLNGLLMTYYALPTVALPLWIVHRTDAPAWTVGALMFLNTVLVVVLQVRASRGSETVPGAAAAIRRSGWLLLVACLLFAVSGHVVALVVGVVVFTFAEMLHSAEHGHHRHRRGRSRRGTHQMVTTRALGRTAQNKHYQDVSGEARRMMGELGALAKECAGNRLQPHVIVLDSFEQAQYHALPIVDRMWGMIDGLPSGYLVVRPIVVGQAPVGHPLKPGRYHLAGPEELSRSEAEEFLRCRHINDPVASNIIAKVGASPLSLRLAAEVTVRGAGL